MRPDQEKKQSHTRLSMYNCTMIKGLLFWAKLEKKKKSHVPIMACLFSRFEERSGERSICVLGSSGGAGCRRSQDSDTILGQGSAIIHSEEKSLVSYHAPIYRSARQLSFCKHPKQRRFFTDSGSVFSVSENTHTPASETLKTQKKGATNCLYP